MTCPKLAPLACSQSGVGFLTAPFTSNSRELHLFAGQGGNFPQPQNGSVFYVDVGGCGCCTRVRIVARNQDTLITDESSTCACIQAGARVAYAVNATEHMELVARSSAPTFLPPLVYDCATHTVSIDCAALKDLINRDCP